MFLGPGYYSRARPLTRFATRENNSEGFHVNDFACASGAAVNRSSAVLALQQVVGILPQRGVGPCGRGSTRTASGWPTVKSWR